MYSPKDMQREISAEIEATMERHAPLHPDWITQAVMNRHPDISGADADFYLCCSRVSVRKEVTSRINKIEKPDPEEKQLPLDGFEHLQQYYVVIRDKERVGVRVDSLSDDELDAKAEEYEAMGRACIQHADELRRYKLVRQSSPDAPQPDMFASDQPALQQALPSGQ